MNKSWPDDEMARRVASFDWSSTPLGPQAGWPQHLRTAVDICLHSRVPLFLAWGPEATLIYNDAGAPLLGDKHPDALGCSYADSFAEIWNYQGPKFRAVLDKGESTYDEDERVCFWRNGILEEMYFTFSWSPVHNPDGGVDGAFHPATETTGYVVGVRRLATLRALASGVMDPRTPVHACRLAATALEDHRIDVPFAVFYLLDPTGSRARFTAAMGIDPSEGSLGSIEVGSDRDHWNLSEALTEGAVVVDIDQRHGTPMPGAAWPEPCRQAMVLPFAGDNHQQPSGLMVVGLSPRRPLDHDYATWLPVLASQVGHALGSAQSRERDRAIAVTLQRSLLPDAMPAVGGAELEGRYRPATDYAQVGGDWYDAIHVGDDHVVVVVGDVMGKGVQAAATMGGLRSATQAYALLGLPPAAIIEELNRFAIHLADAEFATVLCARYTPSSGDFSFASAGHLPPVVVDGGGQSRLVDGGLTIPLAVSEEMHAHEHSLKLVPGDTLLLYTDGLVERRGENLDCGLADLISVCSAHRGDLSSLLDAAMDEVADPDSPDDIAVLALRPT